MFFLQKNKMSAKVSFFFQNGYFIFCLDMGGPLWYLPIIKTPPPNAPITTSIAFEELWFGGFQFFIKKLEGERKREKERVITILNCYLKYCFWFFLRRQSHRDVPSRITRRTFGNQNNTHSNNNDSTWSCSMCTLKNKISTTTCEVCGTNREVPLKILCKVRRIVLVFFFQIRKVVRFFFSILKSQWKRFFVIFYDTGDFSCWIRIKIKRWIFNRLKEGQKQNC